MTSVRVRFFSVLKEHTGTQHVDLELSDSCPASDIERRVVEMYPSLEPFAPVWRIALNHTYTDRSTMVTPGDELALITPVSGG